MSEKRIINWIIFLLFIKEESKRILNKLKNNIDKNLNIYHGNIENSNYDLIVKDINIIETIFIKNDNNTQIDCDAINNLNIDIQLEKLPL